MCAIRLCSFLILFIKILYAYLYCLYFVAKFLILPLRFAVVAVVFAHAFGSIRR